MNRVYLFSFSKFHQIRFDLIELDQKEHMLYLQYIPYRKCTLREINTILKHEFALFFDHQLRESVIIDNVYLVER